MKAWACTLALLCAGTAWGQSTGVTVISYRLDLYDAAVDPYGLGAPVKTGLLAATNVTCDQPMPLVQMLTVANPTRIFWNDAANPGKICVAATGVSAWWDKEAPTTFFVATITAIDDRGVIGKRSQASTPMVIAAPAAVTGVRFVQ